MFALQVQLEVRRSELDTFRNYERHCLRIMGSYGGRLLSAFELESKECETVVETHVLVFETEARFQSYLTDQERLSLSPLAERSVIRSSVARGRAISYDGTEPRHAQRTAAP